MPTPSPKGGRLPKTGGFPDVAGHLRLLAFVVSENAVHIGERPPEGATTMKQQQILKRSNRTAQDVPDLRSPSGRTLQF
jgi:hypothetical protein